MLKAVFTFIVGALLIVLPASATVIEIRTNVGNIKVNLFDQDTPETVQNFLEYVNSGAYANTVVHRLEPNFVMQSGGFQYNNQLPFDNVATGTPVTNEPELSNVRGTIAMAKQAGNANSATSQWFINLADNSQNLDVQNGGFSVFGQVIDDGMQVVEGIADIPRFDLGGAADSIPLRDYSASGGDEPNADNFILVNDIVVIDPETVTNPGLNPVPNTLLNNNSGGGGTPSPPASNPSSGGAFNPMALFCLMGLVWMLRLTGRR